MQAREDALRNPDDEPGFFSRVGSYAAKKFGAVPNEIAANYRDLYNMGRDVGAAVVGGITRRASPFDEQLRRDMAQAKARAAQGDSYPSLTETPFGTHTTGDTGVKGLAILADPQTLAMPLAVGVRRLAARAAPSIGESLAQAGALKEAAAAPRAPLSETEHAANVYEFLKGARQGGSVNPELMKYGAGPQLTETTTPQQIADYYANAAGMPGGLTVKSETMRGTRAAAEPMQRHVVQVADPRKPPIADPSYRPYAEYGEDYFRRMDPRYENTGPIGHIEATQAGGYGDVLYPVMNDIAIQKGLQVGSDILTDDNTLRLIGAQMSSLMRRGKNPRDVRETVLSMHRDLPEDKANFEQSLYNLWKSESDEATLRGRNFARGQRGGVAPEPGRLKFHPDTGYTLDGKPIDWASYQSRNLTGEQKALLDELSPGWLKPAVSKSGGTMTATKVGPTMLGRQAVLDYLSTATKEQARELAKKWDKKKWGALFASAAGAGALPGVETDDTQVA